MTHTDAEWDEIHSMMTAREERQRDLSANHPTVVLLGVGFVILRHEPEGQDFLDVAADPLAYLAPPWSRDGSVVALDAIAQRLQLAQAHRDAVARARATPAAWTLASQVRAPWDVRLPRRGGKARPS